MDMGLFTTESLVEELARRADAGVICISMEASTDNHGMTGGTVTLRRWFGNEHQCLGLCDDLRHTVLTTVRTLPSLEKGDE